MPVTVEPDGSRTTPAPSNSGTTPSNRLNEASYSAVSITCPFAPGWRAWCRQAITMPSAVCSPAMVSPRLRLGRIGASPGLPFT